MRLRGRTLRGCSKDICLEDSRVRGYRIFWGDAGSSYGWKDWTAILTPGRRGSPRLHGKDFSRGVTTFVLNEFETYKPHIIGSGRVFLTYRLKKGSYLTSATLYFGRNRTLLEKMSRNDLSSSKSL